MCWRVSWAEDQAVTSEGRNRLAKQHGLAIFALDGREVPVLDLSPINSRGGRTRGCSLQVPLASLDELVSTLQRIQAHLAAAQAVKAS